MEQTIVYTLNCPITDVPKYVGITIQKLNIRYNEHVSESRNQTRNNPKSCWVKSLMNKGLSPKIEILDIVDSKDSIFFENFYINLLNSWGFKLKNYTGEIAREWKKRNNYKSLKGTKISDEHKRRISEGLNRFYSKEGSRIIGRKQTPISIMRKRITSLSNNLKKYNLTTSDIDIITSKFYQSNLNLYKFAQQLNYPYSFIYNLIIQKKYDILK